jgi:hypothetical protein
VSRAVVVGVLLAIAGLASVAWQRNAVRRLLAESGMYRVQAASGAAPQVTLASLAASPVAQRAFYGHRLEPRDPVVLHGAGQSDGTSFANYSRAVAPAAPMLSMSYVDLHDDLPAFFARLRDELAHYPDLIVPQIGLAMNEGEAKKHYEQQVADGVDDSRLRALCAGLASLDRPVFLRVGYEFNGAWNGYQPQSYVAAFRYIAQSVRAFGLENVALVWDLSVEAELDAEQGGAAVSEASRRWNAFYPGDAWVDWWAINLFRSEALTAAATQAFLAEADRRRFPVMIAESTPFHHSVSEGQRSIDAWFAPYFGLIRSQRGIKAFCYIDWDWSSYPQWADWGDGRIERDPAVLAFFRAQVRAPLIANARPRDATLHLLGAAKSSPSRR